MKAMELRLVSAVTLLLPVGAKANDGPSLATFSSAASSRVAADWYSLPAHRHEGGVGVLSFDVERVATSPRESRAYLHARIVVENDRSGAPWTLAADDQHLRAGALVVRPTFAETSGDTTTLRVAKGRAGWLDVFFPLGDGRGPGRVDLNWSLDAGHGQTHGSTSFARDQVGVAIRYRPLPAPAARFVSAGPAWWYGGDPLLPAIEGAPSIEHLHALRAAPPVQDHAPAIIRIEGAARAQGGVS